MAGSKLGGATTAIQRYGGSTTPKWLLLARLALSLTNQPILLLQRNQLLTLVRAELWI